MSFSKKFRRFAALNFFEAAAILLHGFASGRKNRHRSGLAGAHVALVPQGTLSSGVTMPEFTLYPRVPSLPALPRRNSPCPQSLIKGRGGAPPAADAATHESVESEMSQPEAQRIRTERALQGPCLLIIPAQWFFDSLKRLSPLFYFFSAFTISAIYSVW